MSDDQKQASQNDDTQNNQTQQVDMVGEFACPIDPQALKECEACQ